MPKLFLSYRRDDSLDVTGRIFDRLGSHFGRESVFMDIDTIPYGVDIRSFLSNWITQCDAVMVVMGERWVESSHDTGPKKGQRRLSDPSDFVRIEVASALARNIPVIPVLVGKTTMPAPDQLPEDLVQLSYRNAAEVRSGADFHAHMDRLIRGLEKLLEGNAGGKKADFVVPTLPTAPPPSASLAPTSPVAGPAVAAPMNLGFEHGPVGGMPLGWFNSFGFVSEVSLNYEIKVVPRASSDAGLCVQMASNSQVAADDFGSVMQRCPAHTLAGKVVRFEGSLRTDIREGWAGLWLRLDSSSDRLLFFDNMKDRPLIGTTPWTNCQIKTLVPKSCAWINYGILLVGKGTVWGDHFKVTV